MAKDALKNLLGGYKEESIKKYKREYSSLMKKELSTLFRLKSSYEYEVVLYDFVEINYKGDSIIRLLLNDSTSKGYTMTVSKDCSFEERKHLPIKRFFERNRKDLLGLFLRLSSSAREFETSLTSQMENLYNELEDMDFDKVIDIDSKTYEVTKNARTTLEEFSSVYLKYFKKKLFRIN
jgi:hypothetical protein